MFFERKQESAGLSSKSELKVEGLPLSSRVNARDGRVRGAGMGLLSFSPEQL